MILNIFKTVYCSARGEGLSLWVVPSSFSCPRDLLQPDAVPGS